jgi:hypothetical protein
MKDLRNLFLTAVRFSNTGEETVGAQENKITNSKIHCTNLFTVLILNLNKHTLKITFHF